MQARHGAKRDARFYRQCRSQIFAIFPSGLSLQQPDDDKWVLGIVALQAQAEFNARLETGGKWLGAGYSTSVEVLGLDTNQIRRALSNLKRLEIIEGRENLWPLLEGLDQREADLRNAVAPEAEKLNG